VAESPTSRAAQQPVIERGDTADAMAETAIIRLGCSNISVGSAHRLSFGRFLNNSLASRVLEHASIPVAVVPSGGA
jgi:nucleotide-binding universal stress UspA family protein